jgi:alpha- and gamma-adaptin-binding protein p34
LTGSAPAARDNGSISGLGHEWQAKTAYYTATIPIWFDEIASSKDWHDEFVKPEARQVIEAIGAWIYCFIDDGSEDCLATFIRDVKCVEEVILAYELDSTATMLAVRFPHEAKSAPIDADRFATLEDVTIQSGFELIDYAGTGLNDYGEKQGIERAREALETNDWTAPDTEQYPGDGDDLYELEAEEHTDGDPALNITLLHDEAGDVDGIVAYDQADAVDDLEVMLGKLLTVREQAADLPLSQRKRIAAKAVRDVMRQSD